MARTKPAALKKAAATSSMSTDNPIPVACPRCEYLERQYEDVVSHIREMIEVHFQSLGEKIRELHRWQENRDEAIEAFYTHKRTHRRQIRRPRDRNVA